jgi:hypothetical protein
MKRHPSLTELVLARSSALGHLGMLAGLHMSGWTARDIAAYRLPPCLLRPESWLRRTLIKPSSNHGRIVRR